MEFTGAKNNKRIRILPGPQGIRVDILTVSRLLDDDRRLKWKLIRAVAGDGRFVQLRDVCF